MLFNVDWSFPRIARVGSTPKGCNGWRKREMTATEPGQKESVYNCVIFVPGIM